MARILIIDDSEVMRRLLVEFLCDLGHEVFVAADGEEGVRLAVHHKVDLCICDMHMPKKNGLQVYRELSQQGHQLYFILTDSMPDRLSEQITSELAVHYLRKPFELTQIRAVLDRLLKPARQR